MNLKYLAIGFLFSEGLLKSKDEIRKVVADDRKGVVWVETKGEREVDIEVLHKRFITSGCGRGASFYSGIPLLCHKIFYRPFGNGRKYYHGEIRNRERPG